MILDTFAGPGGWSTGLKHILGVDGEIGIEWDRHANATAAAVLGQLLDLPWQDLAAAYYDQRRVAA